MRKIIVMIFTAAIIAALNGCGRDTYRIAVSNTVNDKTFVYADEEISPTGSRITFRMTGSSSNAEVVLKPVNAEEEDAYEPVLLEQGRSVTINAEKNAWFKVGVRMTDPENAGKKTLEIKGITVRIASGAEESETCAITGVIKEINGTVMTIDGSDGCFNVPVEKMEASPEPQVGDILEVIYDGRIEELYPAQFPGICSLKVYKPVEMTAVVTDFGKHNGQDVLYLNPAAFSSLNNCIVPDWKKHVPDGVVFDTGDEIVITCTGISDEENPAVLCGVVRIEPANRNRRADDPLVGEYQNTADDRMILYVERQGDEYFVSVNLNVSDREFQYWTMESAAKDGDRLTYRGEEIGKYTYDADGKEISSDVMVSNNLGYFEIRDGMLYWTGAAQEKYRSCVFEKTVYSYGQEEAK